jgi:Zn finger protein HypA/HybF involved in hydrogenase expression
MGLWSRLLRWATAVDDLPDDPAAEDAETEGNTVEFPTEPFVFECQSCGKVFESRRKRAQCPECDSTDVTLLS